MVARDHSGEVLCGQVVMLSICESLGERELAKV